MMRNRQPRRRTRRAFTLVEMLVVIAIITLLIAALFPAFSAVRQQARKTQALALFHAIDTGIQSFRTEDRLGGLPPSASDNPDDRQLIVDPRSDSAATQVRVAGAHLLAHALVGADGLGTPGFRDLDRDGAWWNDTWRGTEDEGGLYALDKDTADPVQPRYGGAGYIDEDVRAKMKSIRELVDEAMVQNIDADAPPNNLAVQERMIMDPWGLPILYYKANRAARQMVFNRSGNQNGIYSQEDNGIITGTENGRVDNPDALDFGAGTVDGNLHDIADAIAADPNPSNSDIRGDNSFARTFVRFIHNKAVTARNEPVNKESYLLISAGPDARYGTDDDQVNWTREQDQ